ncbi:chromogranin-A isoform X2 [Tachyglossus aculeatus]|uniref:chromogranin-A isoform X2 n=1 Tax=Tachyglossus aculeatus TaxID=9261 RepID=UPI0018F53DE4|nr:chromogranin-A isoform X2 [Tachyglossus aculeatus]
MPSSSSSFSFFSFFALALLLGALQAIALPVSDPVNTGDTKVMKCIVEVISDTLSKPSPLPISPECLETLRGDERIISILRHQNLLRELQELALQGANERKQQQKKNSDFEEELSEVLEGQNGATSPEPSTESPAEVPDEAATAEMSPRDSFEEAEKNGVEGKQLWPQGAGPEEEEEEDDEEGELESNEITEDPEVERRQASDNHIKDDLEPAERPEQEPGEGGKDHQLGATQKGQELEDDEEEEREKGINPQNDLEESRELEELAQKKQAGDKEISEEVLKGAVTSSTTLEENEKIQREDSAYMIPLEILSPPAPTPSLHEASDLGREEKSSEEEDKSQEGKVERRQPEVGDMAADNLFPSRGSRNQEPGSEASREWRDAKRWNKMDELAKQLMAKKRAEEEDSEEEPDRSMKLSFKTHKYDFGEAGRPKKHHSKEEGLEAGLPLPEDKRDEEGSANRRTEDQELESLAAIEAQLEKVAHKLHQLRRG